MSTLRWKDAALRFRHSPVVRAGGEPEPAHRLKPEKPRYPLAERSRSSKRQAALLQKQIPIEEQATICRTHAEIPIATQPNKLEESERPARKEYRPKRLVFP